jgi:Asp-tRNA(Asn)/Glu-tRNA(Gln) amidotransferase C subunit
MYKIKEINEQKIKELMDKLKLSADQKVIDRFLQSVYTLENQITQIQNFNTESVAAMEEIDYDLNNESVLREDIAVETDFIFDKAKSNSGNTQDNYFVLKSGVKNDK